MADFDDRETAPLAPSDTTLRPGFISSRPARPRGPVGSSQAIHTKATGASAAGAPDWERYGLQGNLTGNSEGHDIKEETATFDRRPDAAGLGDIGTIGENNEIFNEHQSSQSKPWWKANFFVSEPILFGTWDGVFTSCMINIFGVLIFLRTGWMVGNAGLGLSVLIIVLTASVALIAVLSAIGVCERCHVSSGGVYFLLAHVLGGRAGAAVGVVYCFGQAVACSLSMVGFGESISALFHVDNIWVSRAIAVAVLILLIGINVAGVKWVIRLQLVLLFLLFIAVLDFAVGSCVHTDSAHGFIGYSTEVLANNTQPEYTSGESFFTVFGVFFPTATGVFAGINMSGDLRNPLQSIPTGTLSAIGVSTFLYLFFALILGTTCVRSALQTDYMIAEKVSIIGLLFLAGLYISSVSSGMGGLYGAPRILQSIAADGTIPVIRVLSTVRGPNKLPVPALCAIAAVALIFIFIGDVNSLGPVVAMPFMLTYASVDYAYFVLAMSFDWRRKHPSHYLHDGVDGELSYGAFGSDEVANGTAGLFSVGKCNGGESGPGQSIIEKDFSDASESTRMVNDAECSALPSKSAPQMSNGEISVKPRSWYSIFCNRWLSLLGAVLSFAAMFCINWIYALVSVVVVIILYTYISIANPGVFPGIADFSIWQQLRNAVRRCCRRGPLLPDQVVVTPRAPLVHTSQAQLTEDNEDFAGRGRYHQSEVVKGKNFDDDAYPSD